MSSHGGGKHTASPGGPNEFIEFEDELETLMWASVLSSERKGDKADRGDIEEKEPPGGRDLFPFNMAHSYANMFAVRQSLFFRPGETISKNVYRCLLRLEKAGSIRELLEQPNPTSLEYGCASEAKQLFEMVDTGILSKDKWLWGYLLTFDGSVPQMVAAFYQSIFLNVHVLIDESMKDMLAVGKLTLMLYRDIHLLHFSGYFSKSRVVNRFYLRMLFDLVDLGFNRFDFRSINQAPSKMVEWLIQSIKETVDDVRARARAQPGYIPDENKLPSSDEVWNRAKSLKERLGDSKLYAAEKDENVLVSNMPVNILCSAAAEQLDLTICQRLYNKHFVLSKLKASMSLDLDYINELGGLVCVIEAVKTGTGVKVCSCIVKDNLAGFLICMDVGNDRVDTKRRIFLEEAFRYVGTLQVTVTKERTIIKSLQADGSYFQGDFEDFSVGNGAVEGSCAAEALSGLPGSGFLQQSGLQCTALHMIALAICAGAEESVELQWNGERGHISCNEIERYIDHNSKEGGFEVPYSECCVLYTDEGRELARDVLWGVQPLKRKCMPQLASSTDVFPNQLGEPEEQFCDERNGKENSSRLQPSISPSDDHSQEEFENFSKIFSRQNVESVVDLNVETPSGSDMDIQLSTTALTGREAATELPCPPEATRDANDDRAIVATSVLHIESGEATLETNVNCTSTSDVGNQMSTIASTSTEALGEAATGIPCAPEPIGEDEDDTAIAATSLPDRVERLLTEALTKMMYPPEAPTIEEKRKLDETAIAAVLMANKKNFSAGVSILGFGLQVGGERRSSEVDRLIKEYIKKQLCATAYERLAMMSPESRDDAHRHVESKFINGSLKEDKKEYLVIRNTNDNTCVQVFLCDHSTKKLAFLTDVAVGDGSIVTSALNNLRGSWLEVRRVGSDIHVVVPHDLQKMQNLRYAFKIFSIRHNVLGKLGRGPALEGFPPSHYQWKHIIGARRDHEEQGLYWNATELEALVCAATWFTTGSAVQCEIKHFESERHGGCTSSNVRKHCILSSEEKVSQMSCCCSSVDSIVPAHVQSWNLLYKALNDSPLNIYTIQTSQDQILPKLRV